MKTLLTTEENFNTEVLINLDNIIAIEKTQNKDVTIIVTEKRVFYVRENFENLVKELHG